MTSYSSPPRRLQRSTSERVLFGVCGGLARYANLDPTLVRLGLVVLTVFTGGTPILLYVVAWLVMPEDGRTGPNAPHPGFPPRPEPGPAPRPPAGSDPVWGTEGAPWEQPSAEPLRPTPPAPPAPAEPEAAAASAEPADPVDPPDPIDPQDPMDPPDPNGSR